MEWCRMYTLRAVMVVVLLYCGLVSAMPDRQAMSARDQKLQELLKSLDSYNTGENPKPSHQNNKTTARPVITTSPLPLPTVPSFFDHHDTGARIGTGITNENLVPDFPKIESYQDFYRILYGTQEGVNLLRKQYGPTGLQKARAKYGINRDLDDVKLANDHFLRIRNRARCKNPVPQVIRVKDYYPDPSREYLPRCTILHRCGDDTGCCDSEAFHCVPSAVQEVTLRFYTLKMGKYGFGHRGDNSIEKLLFINHTSCQCQPINDLPRMQDGRDLIEEEEEETKQSKCKECPVPFTSRIYKDGRCGCDCFDRQKPCLRIKRGREPLTEIEKRCVEANHCHIPDCEYGLYDSRSGYCPRRHDEDHRVPHRKLHHGSASQRWAFVERD